MTNLKGLFSFAKALYSVIDLVIINQGNNNIITEVVELGTIQLSVCPTKTEIIKALKEWEYLKTGLHIKSFDIDGDSREFVVSDNRKNGYIPCYLLRKVNV